MNIVDEEYDRLLGRIYDAALETSRWPEFLGDLGQLFHGCCSLFMQDISSAAVGFMHQSGFDPAAEEAYVHHYSALDVWLPSMNRLAAGMVVTGETMIAVEDCKRTEFYNDWLRPHDLLHAIGSVVLKDERTTTNWSVIRPERAGPITDTEARLLRRLMPHMQRALQMHRQFAAAQIQRDAALDGLERLTVAATLTDATGRVLFANRCALSLLEGRDGLTCSAGRLHATSHAASEKLRRLMRRAAGTSAAQDTHPGGAISLPRRSQRPLTALVCPFRSESTSGMTLNVPAALVFVRDPEAGSTSVASSGLQALFGLTAGEARIVRALVDGSSPEEIAMATSTSIHTVRTHIKNAMLKVGTNRQGELIAIILRSATTLASSVSSPA